VTQSTSILSVSNMKKITYAGIVVAMVLYVLRLIANTSFAIPLQMRLTGFETESLYSIWKVIHNFDVYTDMYKIPFTSSSFNYLYYFIYGSIIKCVLELFTLSDAWIPQIGRMVTFAACLAGVFFSSQLLPKIVDRSRKNRLLYLGLSFFVFWGPLTGFFSLAVRPDILAVVFELIGLCSFVKLFERRTRTAYLCLIFFSYLAWAIKPTNITFLSGLLVYFVSILSLAWSATLLLGSREYVNMVIFSHLKTPFLFSSTLRYLGHTCIKAAPIFLNIVVLLYLLYKNGRFLKFKGDFLADQHLFKLLICIFTISCGFAFLTSSKAGAGTNYYIPARFLSFWCSDT
jgi:hypothetical protein